MSKIIIRNILLIYFWMCVHPIILFKVLRHCNKLNHKYNYRQINFSVDIWCNNCDEIWIQEIK